MQTPMMNQAIAPTHAEKPKRTEKPKFSFTTWKPTISHASTTNPSYALSTARPPMPGSIRS
jgi:hypothetical protein